MASASSALKTVSTMQSEKSTSAAKQATTQLKGSIVVVYTTMAMGEIRTKRGKRASVGRSSGTGEFRPQSDVVGDGDLVDTGNNPLTCLQCAVWNNVIDKPNVTPLVLPIDRELPILGNAMILPVFESFQENVRMDDQCKTDVGDNGVPSHDYVSPIEVRFSMGTVNVSAGRVEILYDDVREADFVLMGGEKMINGKKSPDRPPGKGKK
ncbi:hypothetical protein NE237_029548 [Protea cynaroides]|uniref:Uncharacterized protein n=1 Tax=Protea cynaroides TaxID=273540 RepID=A0A9Q0GRD0_9MAGN|nr:hypothetical protein NE237_029548 [Protea cynaroides]